MKKFLMILAILLLIGVVVSIFITGNIQASAGNPEEPTDKREPHFHVKDITVCLNDLSISCE